MNMEPKLIPASDIVPDASLSEDEQARVEILDKELHRLWRLGRNLILVWSPSAAGMEAVVIPHYVISEHVQRAKEEAADGGGMALGIEPPQLH